MLQQKPKIVPYEDYKDLIGKPFKDIGRGPDFYDCWGIVLFLYSKAGIVLADYKDSFCSYKDEKGAELEFNKYFYLFEKIEQNIKPEGYDIVLWKQIEGELHFGVVLDNYYFLHTSEKYGVRKNRYDHPFLRKLIAGFYRYKEI